MRNKISARLVFMAVVLATSLTAWAQAPSEASGRADVLKITSPWRVWHVIKPPLLMQDDRIEASQLTPDWIMQPTAEPAEGWFDPDFDDSGWARQFGISMGKLRFFDFQPAMVAREVRRARFEVTDAAAVEDLRLDVGYYGGIIVYLNGEQIARASIWDRQHEGELLAEPYGPEAAMPEKEVHLRMTEHRLRRLAPITIDKSLLRSGVNVLAIETIRTVYLPEHIDSKDGADHIMWGNCGLRALSLTAASMNGLIGNAARPAGLQVWNSDINAGDFDQDWGDPGQALEPIRIVATRNGTFSGKVVVGSDGPIRRLTVRADDLRALEGVGRIDASAIQVRFAQPGGLGHAASHHGRQVTRFEPLLTKAPEVVQTIERPRYSTWLYPKDYPITDSAGAVMPVWVTVNVPADARATEYAGDLRISAEGHDDMLVPINVKVSPFVLPEPSQFETFMDVMQSPDTLALEYEVAMWSEAHWRLIEQSLRQTARAGTRVAYIPLIAETNMGNAESMVRWVKKGDGFEYDFTAMERYLDLIEKTQGKPDLVVLVVWDIYVDKQVIGNERHHDESVAEDRQSHGGRGPMVTAEVDDERTTHQMPHYEQAAAKSAWQPMVRQLMARLDARELTDRVAVGISTDTNPIQEAVDLWKALLPQAGWVRHAHSGAQHEGGVPVVYNAEVWAPRFIAQRRPDTPAGWARPAPPVWTQFVRTAFDGSPPVTHRFQAEMNVAGNQHGVGRIGGDFWPVFKSRRGARTGRVSTARYPRSSWRNLDIVTAYLEPGPEGPVSSARYEMLLEGLQETEARIVIERALADDAIRDRLGSELVRKCEALLAERDLAARRGTSSFLLGDHFTRRSTDNHAWWQMNGHTGQLWFIGSGWQERTGRLYDLAAAVAERYP